jgi:hypothetical protein
MPAPLIQKVTKYWFADDYKGSTIDPNVGVLHTTEGTSLPWYDGGAKAPHYTATPDFTRKRLIWTPHFPDTMSSRALRNEAGGVETNTLNCIQIELVGTCDKTTSDKWKAAGRNHIYWADAPQWALDEVAEFVALKYRELGIRIEGPEQIGKAWRAYPSSYGKSASQRFSFAQWRAFYGWCGHQHVPENDHGDPGNINWTYIETKAKAVVSGQQPIPVTGEQPVGDIYYAHVHAKATALKLEQVMQKIGMTPPNRPAETGTGDEYFAHYWAKYAHNLADLIDAKLTTAPNP